MVAVPHSIADMPSTRFFVNGETFGHVCAAEFSDKHLLFCVYVRDDHDAMMGYLQQANSFRIILHAGAVCVVDQTFQGFRFDRVNYRVNAGHLVTATQIEEPRSSSRLWVAELRFVAPLRDVSASATTSTPSPKEST